jgi:hypothetical protein
MKSTFLLPKMLFKLPVFFFFCLVFNSNSQVIYPYRTCPSPKEMVEFSGIAKIEKNILVGVNDGGNLPCLFFMDTTGRLIKKRCFKEVKNIDWEEICYNNGILNICDVGDNLCRRKEMCIYFYDVVKDSIVGSKKIAFAEKSGAVLPKARRNYDTEAAFWFENKLWLFSKTHASPYKGMSYQYSIDPKSVKYKYTASDSVSFGSQGFLQNSITGAAISPRKYISAFISCTHVWLKFNFFNEPSFFKQVTMDFDFDGLTQKEAITFTSDFKFVVADERTAKMMGGRLYFFDVKPYVVGKKRYIKPCVNMSLLKKNKENSAIELKLKLGSKPKKLHLLLFDKAGKCIYKTELKGFSTPFVKKINFSESETNICKYAVGYWILDDMQVIYADRIF